MGMLYIYIRRGASRCSFQTDRAMRRPLLRGTSDCIRLHAFRLSKNILGLGVLTRQTGSLACCKRLAVFLKKQRIMETKVTVVVPVYKNTFLRECIESIQNQTLRDIKILLVEDGSPDNSGEICDEYARNDNRIKVVHKPNEGINATRYRGVVESETEWIAFCDDDDTLPSNAIEELYLLHENTDIVIGFPTIPLHKRQLSLEECRSNSITSWAFPPTPWAKLYRRSLLTKDIFDFPREIDGEEDMIMNIRLMFKTKLTPRICFKKVYNFRRNVASVSHTKTASLEHEEIFDRVRAESIPQEAVGKYSREIIWSKLNGIIGVIFANPAIVAKGTHPYLVRLKEEIKRNHYHLNLQQWLSLNLHSVLLLKIFAFGVLVKNSIRYRLGLNN